MSPFTLALAGGATCTAAALALAAFLWWRMDAAQDELAAERAKAVKVALAYSENARKVEANWQGRVRDAQRVREAELAASRRADDALRSDGDGMRDDIAAYAAGGADDSIAACRERASTLGHLLARALQADRRSTGYAETHAADARALRDGRPAGAMSAVSE